ncbi:hypothetical protein cyc_04866 [Cyclospora cayetanensis]|uniref:Uncharacterized protein n=1 Tax=Cyclospora cayetanensis TaxID=88456 RepID=A0A1D3CZW7_9EIME|nr:hypothetical protein cyc_04866 [Cyclospora cayetanensis]
MGQLRVSPFVFVNGGTVVLAILMATLTAGGWSAVPAAAQGSPVNDSVIITTDNADTQQLSTISAYEQDENQVNISEITEISSLELEQPAHSRYTVPVVAAGRFAAIQEEETQAIGPNVEVQKEAEDGEISQELIGGTINVRPMAAEDITVAVVSDETDLTETGTREGERQKEVSESAQAEAYDEGGDAQGEDSSTSAKEGKKEKEGESGTEGREEEEGKSGNAGEERKGRSEDEEEEEDEFEGGMEAEGESEEEDVEGATDDDESNENQWHISHLFVGTAYELPVHLRPREGGADPGYLKLVLDEKVFNALLSNGLQQRDADAEEEESDGRATAAEAAETWDPKKGPQKNGVYMVCFVRDEHELEMRFERAMELGEGVYVPLQRMTDFGRHKDYTRGNPGIQETQLSAAHYASALSDWGESYFSKLKELKEKSKLKVAAMLIGYPNYEVLDKYMKKYPGLFDGVYFNWEDGESACMNNLGRPPKTNKSGENTYWADKPDFFFRYFMGGQDGGVCMLKDGRNYIRDVPVNVGRELALPDNVLPVFPCFSGNEGICYKAFSKYIEAACDDKLQRYSFAIYDRHSDRMRLMLEEGCKNINQKVPQMDFVGVL